ncbi:MAG: hypothetical protein U1F52_15895 [Burkholderiales bacterium]
MRFVKALGGWFKPGSPAAPAPLQSPRRELAWAQPTRNAILPATDESALVPSDGVHLHLRDWRQFEFVSVQHLGAVEADLAAIHAIWAHHRLAGQGTSSFRRMHVRQGIPQPLSVAVEVNDLEGMLEARSRAAAFDGHAHPLRDVFAIPCGALVFYGQRNAGRLVTFGVELLGEADLSPEVAVRLQRFIEMNDLMLVHWPSRTLFPSAKAAVSYLVTGAM